MQHPGSDSPSGENRPTPARWSLPAGVDASTWLGAFELPEDADTPRPAVLVAAFGGWQDAGGAASAALAQLVDSPARRRLAAWRGASDASCPDDGWEDWHDLRMHRPHAVKGADGRRHITWPALNVDRLVCDGPVDLLLAHGPEPDIAWDRIVGHLLTLSAEHGAVAAIGLGAVARDVPHTRPWPLSATSDDPQVRETFKAARPTCSGPLGFVDVLLSAADAAGWPTLHLVAGVPSYAGGPPQPVARLRLLQVLDQLCGLGLDLEQAEEDARAWLRGADRLARQDARIGQLVSRWEAEADRGDLPEASGDAIAAELERFLRRRGGQG